MMITDVIREAGTEHEIYFLLTSYVESVRYCDKLGGLPVHMRELPLSGRDDIRARVERLRDAELGLPAATQGRGHAVVAEAIDVFVAALGRLEALEHDVRKAA